MAMAGRSLDSRRPESHRSRGDSAAGEGDDHRRGHVLGLALPIGEKHHEHGGEDDPERAEGTYTPGEEQIADPAEPDEDGHRVVDEDEAAEKTDRAEAAVLPGDRRCR